MTDQLAELLRELERGRRSLELCRLDVQVAKQMPAESAWVMFFLLVAVIIAFSVVWYFYAKRKNARIAELKSALSSDATDVVAMLTAWRGSVSYRHGGDGSVRWVVILGWATATDPSLAIAWSRAVRIVSAENEEVR